MMATDTSKIRSKLTKLNKSLDDLESQLEPLFSISLPETLLALDTLQQAKLQTIIPYVVYDLVFVYLKSRGIDPKSHRVIAELERVRTYFDKIEHAEDAHQKRKLGMDKAAAERFIKHAIAQAKGTQLVDETSDVVPAASASFNERVPIKITGKMVARAEYQKELEQLGGEEEDGLQVFDEEATEEVMDTDGPPESIRLDKGKGRASEEEIPSSKRKRHRVGTLSGPPSGSKPRVTDHTKKAKLSTSVQSTSTNDLSRTAMGEARDGKVTKKAKHQTKKP